MAATGAQVLDDSLFNAGTIKGALNALYPGVTVNVKTFGALGNGTNNDTVAIRAAITSAQSAASLVGSATVYFPAGTYKVYPQAVGQDCLTINTSGITLRGDSPESTIISCYTIGGVSPISAAANVTAMSVSGGNGGIGFAVGDTFQLTGGTGTPAIGTVATQSGGVIQTINVTTPGSYTSLPFGMNVVTVLTGGGSGATITYTAAAVGGNFYRGCGLNITGGSTSGTTLKNVCVKDLRITGNAPPTGDQSVNAGGGFAWDTTNKGVYVKPNMYTSGIYFENVEVDNFLGETIYAGGVFNKIIWVRNCRLHDTNGDGFSASCELYMTGTHIWNTASSCVEDNHNNSSVTQNCYIWSNVFEPMRTLTSTGKNPGAFYGLGISCLSGAYAMISANIIQNTLHDAIWLSAATNGADVNRNDVRNFASGGSAYGGVMLGGAVGGDLKNVSVKGNAFSLPAGATPSQRVIYVSNAANLNNLIVEENEFDCDPTLTATVQTTTDFIQFNSSAGSTTSSGIYIRKNTAVACWHAINRFGSTNVVPFWDTNVLNPTSMLNGDQNFAFSANATISPITDSATLAPSSDGLTATLGIAGYTPLQQLRLSSGASSAGTVGCILAANSAWNGFEADILLYPKMTVNLELGSTGLWNLRYVEDNRIGATGITGAGGWTVNPQQAGGSTQLFFKGAKRFSLIPSSAVTFATFKGLGLGQTSSGFIGPNATIAHNPVAGSFQCPGSSNYTPGANGAQVTFSVNSSGVAVISSVVAF